MSETKTKKRNLLKSPIFRRVLLILLAVVFVASVGLNIKDHLLTVNKTTKLGFENIGELATQAAYCTEVNSTTDVRQVVPGVNIPFTQSQYVYSYDFVIKAGMDFGGVAYTVDSKEKLITVKLPEIRVLSNEPVLDSLEVYLENESIFNNITLEENNAALMALQQRAEADAIANGLLENARLNAKTILTQFFAQEYELHSNGNPDGYRIVFEYAGKELDE